MKKDSKIEIDTYKKPNTFSRAFYKTSVLGQKLFCYSLYKITNEKEIDITNAYVSFSLNDFSKALGISRSGKSYQNIKNAIKEIYDFNITVKEDDESQELEMFRVFQKAKIEKNTITLQFSSDSAKILRKYQKKQYTLLTLSQIGKLKSFYSIRYYETAISWSGQKGKIKGRPNEWFFEFSFDDFKKFFQLEDMRTNNIISRVIKQPIEELNKVSNIEISYELERELKQSPKKIRFWCKFKPEIKEPLSIDFIDFEQESDEEKTPLNEDAQKYDRAMEFKKAHPEEWKIQEQISREALNKIYGASTMQILIDLEIYKELKDKI